MKLGKVIGSVVCTRKEPSWEGVKLLLLQPLDEALQEAGAPLVACDIVQAGPGEVVVYEEGREAALCLANWYNPADACIMGIVDRVDREE
jgi:ethanolamine utilization protein EutN